ncbi:MAG: beta-propeller fold lactonase family protein [Gordonia sp. (in: high G+C Gram-positive bacteria)]|uniref:lactonase family protein n=1 Tax=Gordonia sp. (in: high G+C Gram-positive bacteria) TaxID=84139 RepID=UPI0039E29C13
MTSPTARIAKDRIYVVAQSGGIAAYTAYDDGSLEALPGSPYSTGRGTFCVVTTPDGRFLYVAPGQGLGFPVSMPQTYSPHLLAFRIEDDGTLTRIHRLNFPRTTTPVAMAISADGRNLYVGVGRGPAGFFFGGIQHIRLAEDGTPSFAGKPFRLGRVPDGAVTPVISPDGRHVYTPTTVGKQIARVNVAADGSLSGPVARVAAEGVFPITPAFAGGGRFLYVCNEQSATLSGFERKENGDLVPLPGSPYPTGKIPHNPVQTADGRFIYFANTFSHNVTGYEIGDDGALHELPSSPFRTPAGPAALARSTDGTWMYLVSSPIFKEGSKVVVTSFAFGDDGSVTEHQTVPTDGLTFADGPSITVVPVAAG